jgi:hypothetical protein
LLDRLAAVSPTFVNQDNHMNNATNKESARVRLPKHTTPYIFALYMATIMAFLMSLVITFTEFGIGPHYMENVMNAYQVAMPAAFVCILVVRPIVIRLVGLTVHGH